MRYLLLSIISINVALAEIKVSTTETKAIKELLQNIFDPNAKSVQSIPDQALQDIEIVKLLVLQFSYVPIQECNKII